jgi:hypothetical protein
VARVIQRWIAVHRLRKRDMGNHAMLASTLMWAQQHVDITQQVIRRNPVGAPTPMPTPMNHGLWLLRVQSESQFRNTTATNLAALVEPERTDGCVGPWPQLTSTPTDDDDKAPRVKSSKLDLQKDAPT